MREEKMLVNINGDYALLNADEWNELFKNLQQGDVVEIGGLRTITRRKRKE